MRWVALGVDYEMAGKDLIDSVKLSSQIAGRSAARRRKASTTSSSSTSRARRFRSRRATASPSTNGCAMPRRNRCRCSCIASRRRRSGSTSTSSRATSTTTSSSSTAYPRQDGKQQLDNPVWHIHSGHPPKADMPVTFQLLLTLVSSSNAENAETLWGFIGRYRPGVTPQTHPKLDAMVGYAINYYRDFVAPTKKFREPTEGERAALAGSARRAVAAAGRRDRGRHPERGLRDRSPRAVPRSSRRRARTAAPASRSTGSTCSTRCCSARRTARASARSSRSMACRTRSTMIDGALARSALGASLSLVGDGKNSNQLIQTGSQRRKSGLEARDNFSRGLP